MGVSQTGCRAIPNPWGVPQAVCEGFLLFVFFVLFALETLSLITWVVADIMYTKQKQTSVNYSKLNYNLIFDDRQWVYQSLNTINNNINIQNTEMLQDLHDEHNKMVNDINTITVNTANELGCEIIEALDGTCTTRRRLNSEGKPVVGFEVTWHSKERNQAVSFMELIGESIKDKIGDACGSKPRGKGNKKPKSDKSGSNLFANEDDGNEEEGSNRDLMEVGFEALMEEKLDGVYDSVTDIKTNVNVMEGNVANVKTDVVGLKDKMNMVEVKMNAFEADIADMKGKMDAIEADVTDMKGKMDKIEDKMDTIIEMMTQRLGQEKLVKE